MIVREEKRKVNFLEIAITGNIIDKYVEKHPSEFSKWHKRKVELFATYCYALSHNDFKRIYDTFPKLLKEEFDKKLKIIGKDEVMKKIKRCHDEI